MILNQITQWRYYLWVNKSELEILRLQRDAWWADRPTMARHNENPQKMITLLMGEILEFAQALQEMLDRKEVLNELYDIGWMILSLEISLDTDIYQGVLDTGQNGKLQLPDSFTDQQSLLDKLVENATQMSELIESEADAETKETIEALFFQVCWLVLLISCSLDTDLYKGMMEKHAYNLIRYRPVLFSNGLTYEEARALVKEEERNLGLKQEFYAPMQQGLE